MALHTIQVQTNAGSIGKQLITELEATITELDDHAAAETSGGGAAREGTITRAQARAALREDLEAINRTARMLDDEPGLREKFRVPRGRNDQHEVGQAFLPVLAGPSSGCVAALPPDVRKGCAFPDALLLIGLRPETGA